MNIPKSLQNKEFRFILLGKWNLWKNVKTKEKRNVETKDFLKYKKDKNWNPKGKAPLEEEWQNKNNYKYNDKKLLEHIKKGLNYGIIGGVGNLILIDADSQEINERCKLLPKTFKIKTGSSEEYKNHYYFITDEPLSPIRFTKEKVGDIGDIRSSGQYVVAPNSIHPEGNTYTVIEEMAIQKVSCEFLKTIFKDYIDVEKSTKPRDKKDYKIDTTKRLSQFTKNCRVPDYVLNNKLPDNISKNWELFPYIIDVLNARDVSDKLYEKIAEMQDHDISSVKGWVKSAKEGTLAKCSCKKIMGYMDKYIPDLKDKICEECPLYKKIKEEEIKEQEEELKKKLLEEHKKQISNDEEITNILKKLNILELFDEEFDKKIVKENEARKSIFMVMNMCNVENLNKATDNLMLNAPSGVGKDYISEAIFEILPEEEKEELIRTTPKVLAYTRNRLIDPKATWKKVRLRMEDVSNDVMNDDCFKVMSSAHPNKINKAKTVSKQKIIETEIEGKPSILITIASANPREELLRRYPICNLDQGINQTKEILKRQGEFAKLGKTTDYDEKFKDALRCLKRIKVKIPYADKLVKIFCPENVIVRTHFPRFLDYIKSSCALHQYQRKQDVEEFYIAEKQDYDIARMMLKKTTSNILMIPLTQLLQDIMNIFEEKELEGKSVDDLQDYKEIKKLNIDIEWLRKKLNWLVSKDFLIRDKEKRFNEDGRAIPKPVFIYSLNKIQVLEIPEWDKISSFTLNYKNTSNSSFSSNTPSNRSNRSKLVGKEHSKGVFYDKKPIKPQDFK